MWLSNFLPHTPLKCFQKQKVADNQLQFTPTTMKDADASAVLLFLCSFGPLIDQLREKNGETVSQFLYILKRFQQIKKKKKAHTKEEKHRKIQRGKKK